MERGEKIKKKNKSTRKEGHRNRNIKGRAVTGAICTQKRDTRWVGKREGRIDRRGREERE